MEQAEQIARQTGIAEAGVGIIVTDPTQPDNPITYVNRGFCQLTGYDQGEAVGRNCRFLQGEETDPSDVTRLREAIGNGDEIELVIRNYRKDGETILIRLLIAPVMDEDGSVTAYFGVQRREDAAAGTETPRHIDLEESLPMLRELQHRVKNHLAMVVSMIRLQASRETGADAFRAISHRIEALALLYDDLDTSARGERSDRIDACDYLTRVAGTVHSLDDRKGIDLEIDCERLILPVTTCARLGLLVSELVTNALKHAFQGREIGKVWVRLRALSGDALRLVVEDDGIGMPEETDWPNDSTAIDKTRPGGRGSGGSIVKALTMSLDAGLNVMKSLHGTTITVDLVHPD